MIDITATLTISAFIAGVLMFLAPCTLPLVPAYLAFISGVNPNQLKNPATAHAARRAIVKNGVFFILGFTAIFVLFGILAGFFGSYIGEWRVFLTRLGGVFIIIFGLMMMHVITIKPLLHNYKIPQPKILAPGNAVSSFIIGVTFALGWTPCIGPVLATVLLLATTKATVIAGASLLLVFSAGLAVPFLLTAVLYSAATKFITTIQKFTQTLSLVGGGFLIFIGILLLTDSFGITVLYGNHLFNFFGADWLFDYL